MKPRSTDPFPDAVAGFVASVWLGMIVGVSFLATLAKFQAASLDPAVAVEVGRRTFAVFTIDKPMNSPAHQISKELTAKFGGNEIKTDLYISGSSPALFPVLMPDGRIESSISLSSILANFPKMTVDSIYASPQIAEQCRAWIEINRANILEGRHP